MYFSILRKFLDVGVDMLPPLVGGNPQIGPADLAALTSRIHTTEALELVREHLGGALGNAPPNPGVLVRMSKLQAAQVYAASVMFGYFLRAVDARFQLERQFGTLGRSPEDSVKALEALFNSAAEADEKDPSRYMASQQSPQPPPKASLRRYVESFDSEQLANTARVVSAEAGALVERQTTGLFGSVDALQRQMIEAIGPGIDSAEAFMKATHAAIESGAVETLTLPYASQRRVVLEAVAFGSFLRDVEGRVMGHETALLTTRPRGL